MDAAVIMHWSRLSVSVCLSVILTRTEGLRPGRMIDLHDQKHDQRLHFCAWGQPRTKAKAVTKDLTLKAKDRSRTWPSIPRTDEGRDLQGQRQIKDLTLKAKDMTKDGSSVLNDNQSHGLHHWCLSYLCSNFSKPWPRNFILEHSNATRIPRSCLCVKVIRSREYWPVQLVIVVVV